MYFLVLYLGIICTKLIPCFIAAGKIIAVLGTPITVLQSEFDGQSELRSFYAPFVLFLAQLGVK